MAKTVPRRPYVSAGRYRQLRARCHEFLRTHLTCAAADPQGRTDNTSRTFSRDGPLCAKGIIHEHLESRKASARWVSRQLFVFDRQRKLEISQGLRYRFDTEGQPFLDRIITCDETRVHHFTLAFKCTSKQWKHAGWPAPKRFRSTRPADKVMATVFCPVVPPSPVHMCISR